jgi:hypothetical protein
LLGIKDGRHLFEMSRELKSDINRPALPIILALDTSSKRVSIAIARGPEIIALLQDEASEKRSERLWSEIGTMLKDAAIFIQSARGRAGSQDCASGSRQ